MIAWSSKLRSGETLRAYAVRRWSEGAAPRSIAAELARMTGEAITGPLVGRLVNNPRRHSEARRRQEWCPVRVSDERSTELGYMQRGQRTWYPRSPEEREAFVRLICAECLDCGRCDSRAVSLAGEWVAPQSSTKAVFGCRRFRSRRAAQERSMRSQRVGVTA